MVDRSRKPSALPNPLSPGLQPPILISHSDSRVTATLPSGPSIEILLFGATIVSWKDKSGRELLWLSEASKLDGSKPVRGGIPLVFPVFATDPSNEATSKLPRHGFARTSYWEFLGKSTSESRGDGSVKLDFGLSPSNLSEDTKKLWPHAFGLIYSVMLAEDGLTTSLVVSNEGEAAWNFQTLMHTYFRIQDISTVEVTGLESSPYIDKLKNPISHESSEAAPVRIASKVDRIYLPENGSNGPIVISEEGKERFRITRANLNEVVIWNPWDGAASSLVDFAPANGHQQMICVEAGAVNGWIELGPGDTWEGSQIISSQ